MTTTPTFWSPVITFDQNSLQSFSQPKVTALADDSFAVVWEDGTDIFGKHFDEMGQLTTGNFLQALSTNTSKPIFNPVILQQADGGVVVEYGLVFEQTTMPVSIDRDVQWHSALFDNSTSNTSGIENTAVDEIFLDATSRSDGVGGFGSAVVSLIDDLHGGADLVLRFVSSTGLPASNQIFVGVHAGQVQQNPALAGRHTGQVTIAYENFTTATSARDIRFHTYSLNGTDAGEVIASASDVNAAFPDVVSLIGPSTGNFVVAWQQSGGIDFRRYAGNGTPLDATPVAISDSAGLLPHIAPTKDGGFLVVWGQAFGTESDASADFDLAIQRFDINGVAVGSRLFIDEPGDQGPFSTNVTTLSDGRVLLVFNNETGDATGLTTLDYVILDPRDQTIFGSSTDDTIVGRLDASTINGFGGADHLIGMDANDALDGGDGNDTLAGGKGKDLLIGGANDDTFDFNSTLESRANKADTIKDFHSGSDTIDLSDIDAKTGGADNKFKFIGTQAFHHKAGELHYVKFNPAGTAHDKTVVEGDVNGDGKADLQIVLSGLHTLHSGDFLL